MRSIVGQVEKIRGALLAGIIKKVQGIIGDGISRVERLLGFQLRSVGRQPVVDIFAVEARVVVERTVELIKSASGRRALKIAFAPQVPLAGEVSFVSIVTKQRRRGNTVIVIKPTPALCG